MVKRHAHVHAARMAAVLCGAVALAVLSMNSVASGATRASGTKLKGTTIAVGAISSDSGANTPQANHDAQNALNDWQKYVNSHGGVAGHPVKLYYFNDNSDPGQSASDASTLISTDHVVAIIDDSENDSAWAKTAVSANVPVLCGSQSGNGFPCQSTAGFFPSGTTVIASVYGAPWSAKLAGAKSFGIVYCTEEAACKEAVPLDQGDAKTVGITFGASLAASDTAPSYTAQCVALSQANVDAVAPAGPPSQKMADDCAQQGYKPLWIQSMGTWENAYTKDANLNKSTGITGYAPWFLQTKALKEFHAATGNLVNTAFSPYTVEASWAAGVLLESALAQASSTGSVTPSDVLTGLYAMHNDTLGGLSPPLTFAKGQAASVPCMFVVSIKNKKFVAPHGSAYACPIKSTS
jgi:branched-chain amino acid transport system substrate-binding protein